MARSRRHEEDSGPVTKADSTDIAIGLVVGLFVLLFMKNPLENPVL
jgi:hypothetical protein